MDVLSHGLWALAISKGLNRKRKTKIKNLAGFWWGVFPDLFAFTPVFLYLAWERLFNGRFPNFHGSSTYGIDNSLTGMDQLMYGSATYLYQYSHSLIIFILVFGVVALYKFYIKKNRALPLALVGWVFHILCDIPTHPAEFYPTPFLWPLSDYKFLGGFSWGVPWFMAVNYLLLTIVYIYLWQSKIKSDQITL